MATIKSIFDKRKNYDSLNPNFHLPESGSFYTKYYLDTWYISPFYGKVDTLGVPVVPKSSYLRYCTFGTDREQYLVLQPVLDFFFPLRQDYEKNYNLNAFNKNSKFFKNKLAPKKALINSNTEFPRTLQRTYRNFIKYLLDFNKINLIKNYDSFVNELLIFIKNKNLYFTRAGYVESYDFSLLHTGLALDIYRGDGSNDDLRTEFYNDINGDSFLELCIRNNMKIDREIPWRIFADIRTKSSGDNISFESKIKEYIPNFDSNLQLFFDNFYDRVVPYDENSYAYFEEFVSTLQSFYFSFINTYPTYNLYLVKNCGSSNVLKLDRIALDEDILSFDRSKYVDLYLKFRNAELSKVVPEDRLNYFISISNEIYKSKYKNKFDKSAVIEAIKYYTNNIGTLAYRNPSLYELDEKSKMP